MKIKALELTSLLGLVFAVGSVQAASVDSQLFPGGNWLSDNSAEYLINKAGSLPDDTTLDIGDRLRGIFTIETVESPSSGAENYLGVSGNNELAGVFDIEVTAKSCSFTGSCDFAFKASGALGNDGTTDYAVMMYEDSNYEFTRLGDPTTVTPEQLIANVTNGSLYWAFGFDGVDDFWYASAVTDDITAIGTQPAPGNGGFYNTGLTMLVNNSMWEWLDVSCGLGGAVTADVCASGSLLAIGCTGEPESSCQSGVLTPFDSFDNVDFYMYRALPEPATLALLAVGLLGFGASARARKAKT